MENPANATAWADLTEEVQQTYFDVYGAGAKRPKYRAVKSNVPFPQGAWLLRFAPSAGLAVILR